MNLVRKFTGQERLSKSGQDILWNVVSYGIMGVCGIVLNFIIAGFFGSATLGVYNQVYAVYIIASQFSAAGIHLSVLKYVAEYARDPGQYRAIAASGLLLSVVFGLITCAVVWFSRGLIGSLMDSAGVTEAIIWILPGLFFFTLNKVYLSMLNGLTKMKTYAVFQALRYILMIVVLLLLALVKKDGRLVTVIFSISETLLFVALTVVNLRHLALPTKDELKLWFGRHFSFGMRGFLSNVLLSLNPRVDVLLLGYFCSDAVVGVFSLAAAAAEGLYQLAIVLRTNINPRLVQLLSDQKVDELKALARKSIRFTYIAMLVISLLTVLVYPLGVMAVQDKAEFMASWPFFAILAVGIVLASGYIPFSNILMLAGRPGTQTLMILIQVAVNIALNILLIPILGGIGAAIATALAYAFLVILVKGFSSRVLKITI
jgi:O-antigen/teichoic acid export membrane protein